MPAIVVDPHPLFRLAVKNVLDSVHQHVSVRGTGGSTRTCLELVERHRPQVVVSDLELAASLDLRGLGSTARLIVLAADSAAPSVVRAISVGALSFLHKSVEPATLVDAVLDAARGKRSWYLGDRAEETSFAPLRSTDQHPALTNREKEVFAMLLRRMTNEEIAEELFLARQTVKNYVSSILQKLDMPSRTHLFREFSTSTRQPDTAYQVGCRPA
ncbi:response regulator transcription factor [Saccharopolyspora indica]|uniref:LuxR C-terminal-related transcriptional regulator n=1 Tax=Saccharopolyspora indica TaxID=1229659 RepID=UPI0022EAF2FB|nr:response regulator transcription factor [Saccharopolyspora indica]MDA3648107.1 response regulator transcription factor [Saccharopolyspora indica]